MTHRSGHNRSSKKEQRERLQQSRREFLEKSALLGGAALLSTGVLGAASRVVKAKQRADLDRGEHDYHHNDPENMIFTVCLGCNTGCPTKVKIQDGAIIKIDGSPYTPWTRVPHLPYATPITEAAHIEGSICPKGQAGMMTIYDPHRISKVLKRDGPRGAMRWKTMDFREAVKEIVAGGKLFAQVKGEENREVTGLKALWALRDSKLAGDMGKAVDDIWAAKEPADKQAKVAEFKSKFRDHLDLLIDPDHPDFGPKNNQFLWIHGRLKDGRKQFFERFVKDGMGSVNFHGHTTVCQGSLYFTGKAMSEQYGFDEKKEKADWFGGEKFFWQADQSGAEFILFVGCSPFEANYPPLRTPNITEGMESGRLKFAVADPRFSKTAAKAWKWLPVKPGTEAALALGIMRWMFDHERFDARYLANANKAAATADNEPTWSNACWLVKLEDGKPAEFLRASDLGRAKEQRTATVKDETVTYEFDPFVVSTGGRPATFDPNDEAAAVEGDLFVITEFAGHPVKSALQLLREEAGKHSVAEWAALCDCPADDVMAVAQELTSHGKRGVCDIHRGVSQHTNGFYNCFAFNSINLLLGNYDWRGGYSKAAAYDMTGEKAKGPFDFKNGMHPKRAKPFGIGLLRERKYQDSTLFDGKYPAKRPWFPMATDLYQELLPSVGDAYPYPIKALLLYMGTPGYALPAGNTQIAVLADVEKLPLFIATDITIGESSMFADYIFPDLSFYERWEFHDSHPNNIWKVRGVRQPAIAPLTDTVTVFGEEVPLCIETFMLAVAEEMGLPGYGRNGFGDGLDFKRPDDMYLRMAADLAFGEKEDGSDTVADASDEEVAIFNQARLHLPKSVFDAQRWQAIVGPHWRRTVTVLNRGGRFQDYEKAFDGERVKNKYGKLINLYSEKAYKVKDSMTGKHWYGLATFLPIADSLGRPLTEGDDTLHLITHREIFHTKSRTPGNPFLRELFPENAILINARDAQRLGLKSGDFVRVTSDSNPDGVWELPNFGQKPMVGRIQVIQGIRPGVISFSLGHGHWAYGSSDVWIDGQLVRGDPRRGRGVHANAAMMVDPHLGNICLQDLVGGSVSFYDSPVRLRKEAAPRDNGVLHAVRNGAGVEERLSDLIAV